MNREELAAIYERVSVEICGGAEWCWHGIAAPLERFAALVAAAEREACAKIAWNHEPDENGPIETAIRARGTP